MTNDEILEAAKEAGMAVSNGGNGYWDSKADLERFAKIIERKTIEKHAALKCEALEIFDIPEGMPQETRDVIEWYSASIEAIRKLGEQ